MYIVITAAVNHETHSKLISCWLCVCVRVYVVYEDTNLYNDMGMTEVLQFEGVL